MPNDRAHDVQLGPVGGPLKGYKLWRSRGGARSWRRSGVPNLPGRRRAEDLRFGSTPPEVRFARAYDDFSGGDGYAYRGVAPEGGVHWSENFDLRFGGQAVHCQALTTVSVDTGSGEPLAGVTALFDAPLPGVAVPPVGAGAVVALQDDVAVAGDFDVHALTPHTVGVGAGAFTNVFQDPLAGVRITGRPASFGSFHYVPTATGPTYAQTVRDFTSNTVLSWNGGGRHFAVAGARLWRAFDLPAGGSALTSLALGASAGNPLDWSATIPIGNGVGPITDLLSYREQVFAGRPEGLYAGDQSGSFFNVSGELGGQVHPDNWRDLTVHEGEVVGPHVGGLFAYNPTTTSAARLRQVSPAQRSSRSPIVGRYRATRSFGGWLYAGLFTGSGSYLRAGREAGPGDWRWYTLNRMPHANRIGRIHVDGVTVASGNTRLLPQRLWVATDGSFVTSGTAPLYVQPVPRDHANPLAADPVFSANYTGSARLDLPADDLDAPGITKIVERVEVWADAMASGSRYYDVYYSVDRGARTLLGRAQTSPVTVLPAGSANGFFVNGKSVEWSVESYTDAAGTCPVLRSLVAYGKMRPQVAELIEAQIHAADNLVDRRGVPYRPAAVMLDELRSLADPARLGGAAAVLVDVAGATQYVAVLPPIDEHEVYEQGSDAPEVVAGVRMAVLSLSAA